MNELWAAFWKFVHVEILKRVVTPAGGVGIVEELGSGYSNEEDRAMKIETLRSLGMEAVTNPAWIAHDITGDGKAETFCNRGARFVSEGMGYFKIPRDLYANQMIAYFASSPDWREDTIERAHMAAMKGRLAFICVEDQPNGHLCAVAPEPKQVSGTWGMEVPCVYNVGRKNGLMKLSEAYRFAQMPLLRCFTLEIET